MQNLSLELLEPRRMLSAAYVINGVQPAAYDQPQINALLRYTPTGTPIAADDGMGGTSFDITGFLDTGTSGIVLSQETAQALNLNPASYNGQPIVYEDVGVGGVDEFNESSPLYVNLGPYTDNFDGTDASAYNQQFGPFPLQINTQPADETLGDPLDIIGMPAMQGKVVVMDTAPVNQLGEMRTYLYNPGTPFHSATSDSDPGIPATSLHVKLSYALLKRYTSVTPAGAPYPAFSSNPFVGPAPGVSGDTTPPITIGRGGLSAGGSFLLDTGNQSSFISTAMAAKVHVYYKAGTEGSDNPILVDGSGNQIPDQFQIPIGGIGGATTVAGFYLDSLTLPTQEGTPIKYTRAPVLVDDITIQDPKTGDTLTLDGDIGMNYFVASSIIAGGSGDEHAGDYTWLTIDQPKGLLGLDLADGTTVTTDSIAGSIFKDSNANGKPDAGEGPLASVRVYVDANKNGKFDAGETTVLTDASGNYKISGLDAGSYVVREVTPAGYKIQAPAAGSFTVTLSASQDIVSDNFADAPIRAAITGTIFSDSNGDGIKQSTELGIPSWRVYIDANNNGKLDTSEVSALTDASGNYSLGGLVPGSYVVRDIVAAGWRGTSAASYVVNLAGTNAVGRNFGATQKAKLSGKVFLDANGNTIQDKTEAGLAKWTVYIDANNNGKFDAGELSVITDSAGNWVFNALKAGKYVVRVVQQAGYTRTAPTAGSYTITLSAAQVVSGKTFGEKRIS
jgi:uncharacterized protein (DUF2141 family)